jgi:hypothetical protein
LLSVAAVAVAVVWLEHHSGWTPGKVERAINQEILPGSTNVEVAEWLHRHAIDSKYTASQRANSRGTESDFEWAEANAESLGLHRDNLSGMIWATIEHSNTSWIWDGEFDIFFFFDANDRLVGFRIGSFNWAL